MKEYILELCQRASIILFIFITALFLGIAIGEIIKNCKTLRSFKKERNMLFKRKKKEEPELARVPWIVKKSVIKPTTCKLCRCVYVGNHEDIRPFDEFFLRENVDPRPYIKCPVCGCCNAIEFEEDENGSST